MSSRAGIRVGLLGGAGYAGGELLRWLLLHPEVEVASVGSASRAGRYVHAAHPNLRGFTDLRFVEPGAVADVDVLFVAQPHGWAAERIEDLARRAPRLVDLSADFRLDDADDYARWYGEPHPAPEWLGRFVYGLPELRREALREATYASGVGCNATAANLALLPLARACLVESAVLDLKVGSSEAGARGSSASHHPERAGALRTFAPVSHRHVAEVRQELGDLDLAFTATALSMVRGVLCTAHVTVSEDLEERDLWRVYREAYGAEPFVRVVHERGGLYRHPEPKLVAGTNLADVGFELDPARRRVVALSAIDNLGKGAAGSAVQALNLMFGLEETTGLLVPGLHPVG